MMKKIFAVLLVGLMAVSVAACSNNNNAQTSSQPTGNQQSSVAAESSVVEESKLAEITKTDNTKDDYLTDTKLYNCFYSKANDENVRITLSGDMDINGSTMSVDMDMQKQGDNVYSCMKMMGMTMISIKKDGYTYSLNSLTNTYTKTKTDETSDTSDSGMTDGITSLTGSLKEVKFVENGVSNEEGTTDYEKYSMTGSTMTVYFDGDAIKFIDVEQDTTTSSTASSTESSATSQKVRLNISVTSDIDATLFEIPEGYTEQSSDDTLEQVSVIDDISLADGVSLIEDTEE